MIFKGKTNESFFVENFSFCFIKKNAFKALYFKVTFLQVLYIINYAKLNKNHFKLAL